MYEDIFRGYSQMHRAQGWESTSGPGSGLAETRELRAHLPGLLRDLQVRTLVDAPCGDFNWMQHVDLGVELYIGVDVQNDAIAENQQRHGSATRRFVQADLVRDALPQADAILCRDLLVHLSFEDIARVLANFRRTGATYLITTTFPGDRPNVDIPSGSWRTLNLTLPPFNFPEPLRLIDEKCTEANGAFSDKSLGVWRLADLKDGNEGLA